MTKPAVGFSLIGLEDVDRAIDKLQRALQERIARAINASILRIHKTAVESIQDAPAGGVHYERLAGEVYMTVSIVDGGRKTPVAFFKAGGAQNLSETHKASAPGEPPKTDTGELAGGIVFNIKTGGRYAIVGEVQSTAPHSGFMEFGTDPFTTTLSNGRQMRNNGIKPRPFMRPAWDANKKKIMKWLTQAIEQAVAENTETSSG